MWVPWLILAVAAFVIGGAWFVVLPFVFAVSLMYLARRKVEAKRVADEDYAARTKRHDEYIASRREAKVEENL
jgi:hypothetical protein